MWWHTYSPLNRDGSDLPAFRELMSDCFLFLGEKKIMWGNQEGCLRKKYRIFIFLTLINMPPLRFPWKKYVLNFYFFHFFFDTSSYNVSIIHQMMTNINYSPEILSSRQTEIFHFKTFFFSVAIVQLPTNGTGIWISMLEWVWKFYSVLKPGSEEKLMKILFKCVMTQSWLMRAATASVGNIRIYLFKLFVDGPPCLS